MSKLSSSEIITAFKKNLISTYLRNNLTSKEINVIIWQNKSITIHIL